MKREDRTGRETDERLKKKLRDGVRAERIRVLGEIQSGNAGRCGRVKKRKTLGEAEE